MIFLINSLTIAGASSFIEMFDGRKIESAVREVYSFLYPDKKERKKALARLDMETLVQSIRYRCETPLAYYATGSADLSMKYHGPDLFDQKACMVYQEPLQVFSTMGRNARMTGKRNRGRTADAPVFSHFLTAAGR